MVSYATSFQNPYYGTKSITFGWAERVGDYSSLSGQFGNDDLRHRGVDYGISNYQSVLATATGVVVDVVNVNSSNVNQGFGTYVVIKHTLSDDTPDDDADNDVVYSLYVHLYNTEVSIDEVVQAGDLIGSVGDPAGLRVSELVHTCTSKLQR